MKQISVRDLLRHMKMIFPIPEDGIEMVRRGGGFFIYPREMKPVDVDKLAQTIVDKMKGITPATPKIEVPALPPLPVIPELPKLETPITYSCNWQSVIPIQPSCGNTDTKKVKFTSLVLGAQSEPQNLYLCPLHLQVVKKMNAFSVEEL